MTNVSVAHEIQLSRSTDLWGLAPHQPAPRDARRLLVAVASGGGGSVDGNFEDAEAFLLYEKCGCNTSYIGRQPCPLTLAAGDPARRARLLADCDLVLCADISGTCMKTLSALGVACNLTEAGTAVSDAVSAL